MSAKLHVWLDAQVPLSSICFENLRKSLVSCVSRLRVISRVEVLPLRRWLKMVFVYVSAPLKAREVTSYQLVAFENNTAIFMTCS